MRCNVMRNLEEQNESDREKYTARRKKTKRESDTEDEEDDEDETETDTVTDKAERERRKKGGKRGKEGKERMMKEKPKIPQMEPGIAHQRNRTSRRQQKGKGIEEGERES